MEKDKKGQLYNRLIHELISRIAGGTYKSGWRLPSERKLSEEFGLSRGTIRRSLAELEKTGAIEIRPQSGAFVQKLFLKKLPLKTPLVDLTGISVRDVAGARLAIESAAIERFCENINQEAIDELQRTIEDMERNIGNEFDFAKFDMKFHELLVRYSDNPLLIVAFAEILEYQKYYYFIERVGPLDTISKFHNTIDAHKEILNALKNRNKKQVIKQLEKHFEFMRQTSDELGISQNDKQSE